MEFYVSFSVFKTSANLIILPNKFSSVLYAAVAELFSLLSLPPLIFLLHDNFCHNLVKKRHQTVRFCYKKALPGEKTSLNCKFLL